MPKKRNKKQKETKTRELKEDMTKKESTTSPPREGPDSPEPSVKPSTSNDTNNLSTICSEVLTSSSTTTKQLLGPEEKGNATTSHKQESVTNAKNIETTKTTSNEITPEEHGEKTESTPRSLQQMLLSPKSGSGSVSLRTERKKKNTGSKGNKKEDKPKQPAITDHFVTRKSQRKCKSIIEEEKQNNMEEAVLEGKEEGIEVKNIEGKGRGVFAIKAFQRGDFICEYHGDHIDYNTAKEREKKYSEDKDIGCYMYYFSFKNKKYCVDATQESGRLGRLLNHSIHGNCTTKLISIKEAPCLILVAAKYIQIGEELLYDYGERNKDAIASHPWLQA